MSDCGNFRGNKYIGRESFIKSGGENFDLIPCLNDSSPIYRFASPSVKKKYSLKRNEFYYNLFNN